MTSSTAKKANKKIHKYCFFCGENDYNSLHNHRIIPGENGGTYNTFNTLVVCANCHCKVHSGRIKIDRKYTQTSGVLKVHYFIDGKEYWRDEELGYGQEQTNFHPELSKSHDRGKNEL